MSSFMKSQSETDKAFLDNLFTKPTEQDPLEVILQVREKGDPYCTEIEVTDEIRTMANLARLIRNEYGFDASQELLIFKHPDILIRNDREVQRIKHRTKLQFYKYYSENPEEN